MVDRRETWNEGPPGTEVEGLAAAYRDRFPLKVREQGAGLEDGRRGRANGAWARASLWTAPAATVSPARGSKSGSPLGGEGVQGTGAKLA